jgi:GNAT superfamily N-acetyltransferase
MSQPLELTARLLGEDTWPDFEAMFARHKGVRGGCWCAFYLTNATQYEQLGRDGRREYHRALALKGLARGILLYDGEGPVAWCQFGPPEVLVRHGRGRDYVKLVEGGLEPPDWRITCLFTDKRRRGVGISVHALRAALREIARLGGGLVEAFPFDIPGKGHNQHTGSVDMFLREGFEPVTRLGLITLLMRRRIESAD